MDLPAIVTIPLRHTERMGGLSLNCNERPLRLAPLAAIERAMISTMLSARHGFCRITRDTTGGALRHR